MALEVLDPLDLLLRLDFFDLPLEEAEEDSSEEEEDEEELLDSGDPRLLLREGRVSRTGLRTAGGGIVSTTGGGDWAG